MQLIYLQKETPFSNQHFLNKTRIIFGLKILLLISKKPIKQSFHSHLYSSVNIDFQLRKKSKAKTYKKRALIHLIQKQPAQIRKIFKKFNMYLKDCFKFLHLILR